MAIFRERFDGHSLGNAPSGWTADWASSTSNWSVIDDVEETTGGGGAGGDVIGGGDGYSDTFESGDYTVNSANDLGTALSSATSGEVVFVESEIHTGSNAYTIPGGVTVASDRGVDGSPGALIDHGDSELFDMDANSRLTGVQIFGPWDGDGDGDFGHGIDVAGDGVEIDNCEIAAFGEASVSVEDNHDCHLHHCHTHDTNKGGTGYGIDLNPGASAVIERNYMENHRHCVAGNGNMSGYTVRYNHIGPKQGDVMIDAHGQSGNAGDYSEVNNNIVEATEGYQVSRDPTESVQIRGTPTDAFHLWDNWFYNPGEPSGCSSWCGDAIIQPSTSGFANVYFSESETRSPDENHYGSGALSSFTDVIPNHPGTWHRPWDSSPPPEDTNGETETQVVVDFADDRGLELSSSSDARHAIQWDDVGEPDTAEVLSVVYVPSIGSAASSHVRSYIHAGGTESDPQAYYCEVLDGEVGVSKYENGSATTLATDSPGVSEGTWYNIRFRASGGNLRVRYWERGTSESDTWDIDVFDDTYSSGWVGLGSFAGDATYWDDVTVGTDGQSAPIPGEEADPAGGEVYGSTASGKLQTDGTGVTLTDIDHG